MLVPARAPCNDDDLVSSNLDVDSLGDHDLSDFSALFHGCAPVGYVDRRRGRW
jgi:hypothetical protein